MEIGWFVKHEQKSWGIGEIVDIEYGHNGTVLRLHVLTRYRREEFPNTYTWGSLDSITRVNADGTPYVEAPEPAVEPEPPAPRPYQVGDRVRFTNACPQEWWFGPHTRHNEGVISSVDRDGLYSMEVRVEGGEWDGSVSEEHIELILEAEVNQIQNKATIERFVIIFHNPNLNKISTEIKASERAAQEFIRSLGRHATVLKTTKVKFEIPLDGLPEGVRW